MYKAEPPTHISFISQIHPKQYKSLINSYMNKLETTVRLVSAALLGLLIAFGTQILLVGMFTLQTMDVTTFSRIQGVLEILYLLLSISIALRIEVKSIVERISLGPIEVLTAQRDTAIRYLQSLETHVRYNDNDNVGEYNPYSSTELELQIQKFYEDVYGDRHL